ncbi:Hypothetical protein MVR_LOCUS196 [uncultured virus]|nr:Hypothetical protein MVR_LOCUS196 [uncultured virus]
MTSKNTYRLINPLIEGSESTVKKASNSFNVAKKFYKSLSSYFTNRVDQFHMTVKNLQTGGQTHYLVSEDSMKQDGSVGFSMTQLPGKLSTTAEDYLNDQVNEFDRKKSKVQEGGKRRRRRDDDDDDSDSSDSDSDSDSDFEYIMLPPQPITRFVYFNMPYYKIYGVSPLDALRIVDGSRIYTPTFSLPVNPSIEIRLTIGL